jgi:hypothetical protein
MLYLLRDGCPWRAEVLYAPDDVDAVRQATALVEGPAELWCGARKVKMFNPA